MVESEKGVGVVLPLALSIRDQKIVVVGRGRPGQQRYELVYNAGAERISLFAIDQDGWACHAQALLYERLPETADFRNARIVFIAGLKSEVASRLAEAARAAGALVNVEDQPELCDFHVPAIVRRGDLTIAISTGGRVPGLAQRLRMYLEGIFGFEWEARVRRLSDARASWRSDGLGKDEIVRRSAELIEQEKWLDRKAVS